MRLTNGVNEKRRELRRFIAKNPTDLEGIAKLSDECHRLRNIGRRDWINANPKEHIEILERRNKKSAEERRTRVGITARTYADIFKNYGMTKEEYDAMLKKQNNACAICGSKRGDGAGRRLHCDHDHRIVPIKVRGLICNSCNHLLGLAKDNPTTLRIAAKYLEDNSGCKC